MAENVLLETLTQVFYRVQMCLPYESFVGHHTNADGRCEFLQKYQIERWRCSIQFKIQKAR